MLCLGVGSKMFGADLDTHHPWLLPRDATQSAVMQQYDVRLSVCP